MALTKITGEGVGDVDSLTVGTTSSGEFNALTISQADNTSGNESRISFKRTADAGSNREVAAIVADREGGNDTSLVFETNTDGSDGATERVRINHTGFVGIGTSDFTTQNGDVSTLLKLGGANNSVIAAEQTGSNKNFILEGRNEGRSGGDRYAQMSFAEDGSDNGAITFLTAASGSDVSERVRINSGGSLLVGKTDTSTASEGAVFTPGDLMSMTRNGEKVLRIRRNTDDGTLMEFFQDGNQEGKIQVTGSTVQYVGGTLARFSQATDGNRIDGLVKGTVMTNLDQMAVWHHEAQPATYYVEGDELPEEVSVGDEKTPAVAAYDEENEQLNCMAVSSVEGDANVAGVFVNWDDEDEDYTADMHVAMTGDFVIRIAKDTTVARGDLLMSAGDGTAKPQDDDIVRSKTIAKVISTTKAHTYDDGSYLVPCVLMAC